MDSKEAIGHREQIFRKYFSENHILIADSNSSARTSLMAALVKFGASRNHMALVGTMEEARTEITKLKPKIIFCDYLIGKESGLDLIQDQKVQYQNEKIKDNLFVLVTGNASQSTVARAAEEDVDTFVIKPYTINNLQKSLLDAVVSKIDPEEYIKIIEKGKELLFQGKPDEAILQFTNAMKLKTQPTLACYYHGQAEAFKTAFDQAKNKYKEGLNYNKIHYKCLIGLYETLMKNQKIFDAYDVVKRVAQYFPANPHRLASVLRLAIMTKNYEDIEGYYRIFTAIEQRTDELVRYICSALCVTGKYYLTQKTKTRALSVFENVAVSAAGRTYYLRYIVETLVEFGYSKDAEPFLKRFPADTMGKTDYLVSQLLITGEKRPSSEVISQGRNLLKMGIEDPSLYTVLIRHSQRLKLHRAAEDLAHVAAKKWEDQSKVFLNLIKSNDEASQA